MTQMMESPYFKVVAPASPAAGQNVVITGAGQGGWLIHSVRLQLTTDATVAGREVALVADDGTTAFFQTAVDGGQAASTTSDYGTVPGAVTIGGAGVFRPLGWPPNGIWLRPGWRLRTDVLNLQAGDQISEIGVLVEEYPTNSRYMWTPSSERVRYELT